MFIFIYRPASVMTKRKRPLGKSALESRPKLFGGSIEEYVQVGIEAEIFGIFIVTTNSWSAPGTTC